MNSVSTTRLSNMRSSLFSLSLVAVILVLLAAANPALSQDEVTEVGPVAAQGTAPAVVQSDGFDFSRAMAMAEQFESIPNTPPPITNWMTAPVTSIARQVKGNALWIGLISLPFLILPNVLLLISIFRFREDGVRKPATFHENIELEMVWTIVPVFALVVMAVPSYHLMRYMENPPEGGERVEVIGHQFFWEYRFPEYGIVYSDEPLVVPVGSNIVLDMTSSGVNHAWWVPSFGVKMDTVPGRINTIWFNVEETGWYKGQCAELCGALHARMLIDVFVVTQDEFDAWVNRKIAEMEEDGEPALESVETEAATTESASTESEG